VIGSLSDRIGRYTPIVVGLFASVVVFAAFPSVSSPTVMVALMALLGCCAVLEFPASQAVTMEALPAGERGMATGVWGMMMSLGGTLGMFALSYVVGVAPIEWFFYACAGFSLAGGVLLFLIRGWFKA
jgi:MFS family permease